MFRDKLTCTVHWKKINDKEADKSILSKSLCSEISKSSSVYSSPTLNKLKEEKENKLLSDDAFRMNTLVNFLNEGAKKTAEFIKSNINVSVKDDANAPNSVASMVKSECDDSKSKDKFEDFKTISSSNVFSTRKSQTSDLKTVTFYIYFIL